MHPITPQMIGGMARTMLEKIDNLGIRTHRDLQANVGYDERTDSYIFKTARGMTSANAPAYVLLGRNQAGRRYLAARTTIDGSAGEIFFRLSQELPGYEEVVHYGPAMLHLGKQLRDGNVHTIKEELQALSKLAA